MEHGVCRADGDGCIGRLWVEFVGSAHNHSPNPSDLDGTFYDLDNGHQWSVSRGTRCMGVG
jgi:hypothetical protein